MLYRCNLYDGMSRRSPYLSFFYDVINVYLAINFLQIISVMVAREEGLPLVDISWDIGTSNVHHPYQVTLQGTAQICTSHATRLSIDLARDYRLRVRSLRTGGECYCVYSESIF